MRAFQCVLALALALAASVSAHHPVKVDTLASYQHGVEGEIFAVNESTLFVKDFEYDGQGPDAFFWVGTEGEPGEVGTILPYPFQGEFYEYTDSNAPIITGKFDKVNITLTLPEDLKVTDLKWISVWCRQFSVNFADAFFPEDLSFDHDGDSYAEPEDTDAEPEHEGDHHHDHHEDSDVSAEPEHSDAEPEHSDSYDDDSEQYNKDHHGLPHPLDVPNNAHDPNDRYNDDPDVGAQSGAEPESEGDHNGSGVTMAGKFAETSLGRSVVASVHQLQQQLSTFKPPQCSPLLLQIPASQPGHAHHHRTSSGVDLGSHRSSGDGGSEIDMESEAPYATLKARNEIETEEEEESHYSLIRQPDGRADDPAYSPLGVDGGYLGSAQSSDDAGYESLHQHQEALKAGNIQHPPMNIMGIESTEVREKVYETLRRHEDIMTQSVLSTGCSSSGSSHSVTAVPGSKSIKGIRSNLALRFSHPVPDPQPSPPELPPPPENCDISALYAKVDRSKKKKNRDSASSSDTTPCSPHDRSSTLPGHAQSQVGMSPTKSLIQKFNTLGTHERLEGASPGRLTAHRKVTHVQSNPTHSTSSSSLSTTPSSSATPTEPMYATIGNKNRRLTAFHHAANV